MFLILMYIPRFILSLSIVTSAFSNQVFQIDSCQHRPIQTNESQRVLIWKRENETETYQ